MKVDFSKRNEDFAKLFITPDNPKEQYYGESAFYYALKKKLIEMGYDVIKKLMWKDGHMVDDNQYYIRSRSRRVDKNSLMIVYPLHATFLLNREFNDVASGESSQTSIVTDVYYNIFQKG